MQQQNIAMNKIPQQGSQRQDQAERLHWRQSDIAQRDAVKMVDALHSDALH